MARREKAPALIRKGPSYLYRAQWTEQGVKQRAAWVVGRVCEPVAIAERNAKVCRSMVRAGRAHEVPAFLAGKLDPGPSLATTPGHDVSVQELAEDLFETEQRDNPRRAKELLGVYNLHVKKGIGRLPVAAVTPAILRERVFEDMADRGLAQGTLRHVRNTVRKLFRFAMFRQLIQANPLDAIWKMPRAKRDTRPFVLPTDEEFGLLVTYLYSRPAQENIAGVGALELATLVVASRCIGGQRTSDLHAWRWSDIDLDSWKSCKVRRPKTEKRDDGELSQLTVTVEHLLHEDEREALRRWWEAEGCPRPNLDEGHDPLVFPTRTGPRAGLPRKGTGYAESLRVAMRRALGIEVPKTITKTTVRRYASGKTRPMTYETTVWVQVREPQGRERTLLEGDERFRPLNMHTMRRAYASGLALAGWSRAKMRTAGGWSTDEMPARYDLSAQREVVDAPTPKLKLVKTG